MPFIPVPEAVQVRLRYTLGTSEQCVNVLHYHNVDDAPINADSVDEIGQFITDAYEASGMLDYIHTSCTLVGVDIKDISAPEQPTFIEGYSIPGESADADALPFSVALCASLKTANGSRGGRGRMFQGGFASNCLDPAAPGLASVALRSTLIGWVNSIKTIALSIDFGGAEFVLGVVSREAHVGGDPEAAPIAPTIRKVEQVIVNRRWDTQRRRSNKLTA